MVSFEKTTKKISIPYQHVHTKGRNLDVNCAKNYLMNPDYSFHSDSLPAITDRRPPIPTFPTTSFSLFFLLPIPVALKTHRDKLAVDSSCQIFVASEGQWVDAVVLAIEPDAPTPVAGTTRR